MNKIIFAVFGIFLVVGVVILMSSRSKPSFEESVTVPTITANTDVNIGQAASITITKPRFDPKTITVSAGTKVIFTNKSGSDSDIASAVHPTHLVYPPLNLGVVADGASVSLVFDKPGSYKYHDHFNPSRTGTIIVK